MSLVKFNHRGKNITLSMDDDVIEKHIRQYDHFYEHWMLEATKNLNGIAIDAGSNFGNHAVYYSMFANAHEVIAIEPVWENYRNLCYNIGVNGCTNIKPIYAGVSDKKGWTGFSRDGRWSQCTLKGIGNIPVITIDSLELSNVALIKIDCEAMEDKVLKGAMETIEKFKPDLFIESFDGSEWLEKILCPLGYKKKGCYNPAPTYHFSYE
jgi:protein O-GlcNAc transferase